MTRLHSEPRCFEEEDLVDMAKGRLGWAIAEQLEDILAGKELEDQNYNALHYIRKFLEQKGEWELADEIDEFLRSEGYYRPSRVP